MKFPAAEALFNLADAWSMLGGPLRYFHVFDALLAKFAKEAYAFMLLPLLLWDRPQRNVYNWWAPAMFLTNALRNCRETGSPRVARGHF
jgi:hypothetical protein